MKKFYLSAAIALAVVGSVCAQQTSRDEKIKTIHELRDRIGVLEQEVLRPEQTDIDDAGKQGFTALRLLPREKYDGVLKTRGGGSYYSFTRNTHEYGTGSEIGLEQEKLRVGFYGGSYGFFLDLGQLPLESVTMESPEIASLTGTLDASGRSPRMDMPHSVLRGQAEAKVSNTYALRSIDSNISDVLVAFKILRKDADGSLVLMWKTLKTYKKPAVMPPPVTAAK